ncbi:MAG: 16S rRNA (guanine(527)-N(7))-methyltransferase RsmG [Rhodobacteraceae bacterium]|nr:16S rRNA (guanine(527)-N(7))-methyltransferase RsmG [Paracoccaceae bacterium]
MDKLTAYAQLLQDWNRGINLVAKSTIDDLWHRHILDSAQLFRFRPEGNLRWLDIGTGAGLPGIVLAVLAECDRREHGIHLVEANARRVEFLRLVRRELDVDVRILHGRSEMCMPFQADIIAARAVADLTFLIDLALPHLAVRGCCIFPKGREFRNELRLARQKWRFSSQCHESVTSRDGRIVALRELSRA